RGRVQSRAAADIQRAAAGSDAAVDVQQTLRVAGDREASVMQFQSRARQFRGKSLRADGALELRRRQRATEGERAGKAALDVGDFRRQRFQEREALQVRADAAAERMLRAGERDVAAQ